MQNQNEKRTYRKVVMHVMRELGGEQMEREFVQRYSLRKEIADKELTEEQYQYAMQRIKEELPHFKLFLLTNFFGS